MYFKQCPMHRQQGTNRLYGSISSTLRLNAPFQTTNLRTITTNNLKISLCFYGKDEIDRLLLRQIFLLGYSNQNLNL
jgi:hypothetical protein